MPSTFSTTVPPTDSAMPTGSVFVTRDPTGWNLDAVRGEQRFRSRFVEHLGFRPASSPVARSAERPASAMPRRSPPHSRSPQAPREPRRAARYRARSFSAARASERFSPKVATTMPFEPVRTHDGREGAARRLPVGVVAAVRARKVEHQQRRVETPAREGGEGLDQRRLVAPTEGVVVERVGTP